MFFALRVLLRFVVDVALNIVPIISIKEHTLKNANNCYNTNNYSYIETSGGQSSHLHLNVAHFFNTSVNLTSVAAQGSRFPALVSNMCSSNTAVKGFMMKVKEFLEKE
jgi:hypothetical protein